MPQKIEAAYIEMTQHQADADYGKMRAGRIYQMPPDRAERFVGIGVAKSSTASAFDKQQKERADRVEQKRTRAGEFAALNAEGGDPWDASESRDVTTATEAGLKRAFEQGRLVNTDRLLDEHGNPLPPDASFEDIMAARNRLHYVEAPLTDHERSSVQGGGSHTYTLGDQTLAHNEGSTLAGKAPLNAPSQKLTPAQLGNGPAGADDDSDDAPKGGAKRVK